MKGPMLHKVLATMAVAAMVLSIAGAGCATPVPEKKVLELRVGTPDLRDQQFDPMILTQTGTALVANVFDNPFEMTPEGGVAPGIVKKWEIAADGKSWTLFLRDDVLWQDGTKLTSADMAFSYERSVKEGNYQASVWKEVLGPTPKVEVLDPYSLRVFTNGPQPLLAIFSTAQLPCQWVVPKAYIEKNGQEFFARNPMGSGPYKLVKSVQGDRMEFEAVTTSWQGKPQFDRVVVYQIPEETTRIAMLQKGELDAIPASLESAISLSKKGFDVQKVAPGQAQLQFLGTYMPQAKGMPLADVRVRQALSLAINREEIQNTLMGGLGVWPAPLRLGWENADLTPALRAKWLAWSKVNFRYDPAEAKRLLAEAGYANGLTFELWLPPDSSAPYLADAVTACINYWAQIGVKANLTVVDSAAWSANKLIKTSPKLIGYAAANASNNANPSTVKTMNYFTSVGSADLLIGSPLEGQMDALYKEGLTTMDPARLEQILDKMIEISTSSWTGYGIASGPTTYAFGPRVKASLPSSAKGLAHFYVNMAYTGK